MTDLHEVVYVIISKVIDYTRKALKLCMHRPKANFDTALVFKYDTLNADHFFNEKANIFRLQSKLAPVLVGSINHKSNNDFTSC